MLSHQLGSFFCFYLKTQTYKWYLLPKPTYLRT